MNNHTLQYRPYQLEGVVVPIIMFCGVFECILAGPCLLESDMNGIILIMMGISSFLLAKWCRDRAQIMVCFEKDKLLIFDGKYIEVCWDKIECAYHIWRGKGYLWILSSKALGSKQIQKISRSNKAYQSHEYSDTVILIWIPMVQEPSPINQIIRDKISNIYEES